VRVPKAALRICCGVVAAASAAACTQPPPSPEDEIRAFIAKGEAAVEAKDIQTLKDLIADRYRDEEQRDKQALKGILAYYFLQHRTIHLLIRVQSIRFPDTDAAEVDTIVAMAGREIGDTLLPDFGADIYHVEMTLRREDETWRVHRAAWSEATAEDLR
jgi:hypothetical protein